MSVRVCECVNAYRQPIGGSSAKPLSRPSTMGVVLNHGSSPTTATICQRKMPAISGAGIIAHRRSAAAAPPKFFACLDLCSIKTGLDLKWVVGNEMKSSYLCSFPRLNFESERSEAISIPPRAGLLNSKFKLNDDIEYFCRINLFNSTSSEILSLRTVDLIQTCGKLVL